MTGNFYIPPAGISPVASNVAQGEANVSSLNSNWPPWVEGYDSPNAHNQRTNVVRSGISEYPVETPFGETFPQVPPDNSRAILSDQKRKRRMQPTKQNWLERMFQ